MAHALLVTVAELSHFGITAKVRARFRLRTLQIQIAAAGALGTMTFKWRALGDVDWSYVEQSSPAASFEFHLTDGFAVVTFGAGSYLVDSIYTINEAGTVTRTGGAIDTVTATRYDVLEQKCQAATDMAIEWMKPEVKPPLISWGQSVRENCANVVKYLLLSYPGMAPTDAAVGDSNVRLQFEDARTWFQRIGKGYPEPEDLVDSSTDAKPGHKFPAPVSDEKTGW